MIHPKNRWDTCFYMSSTSNIKERWLHCFGMMESLTATGSGKAGLHPVMLDAGVPWALDNGAFTGKFEQGKLFSKMEAIKEWKETCLFIVTPDVVGDHVATLAQFPRYAKIIRKFGYPVAFISQDGLAPNITPWDDFEVLFIGGTDEHKLGREAGLLIDEAIRRGKWVHIGRVNSRKRILQFWRADSWDGTHIGYEPDRAAPAMARAVLEVRAMKTQQYKLWEGF